MSNYPPSDPSNPQENPYGYVQPTQPPPVPPPPPPQGALPPDAAASQYFYSNVDKDTSDLKTLSIFWYIVAGFQALGACVFLLYIGFGLLMLLAGGAAGAGKEPGAAVPIMGMGAFMLCLGIVPMALILTLAWLNFTVARSLPLRKNRTLCHVMAGLLCAAIPLGTILGIFTFVVLSRPSVRAMSLQGGFPMNS